jgi:hypothetical protein
MITAAEQEVQEANRPTAEVINKKHL